MKTQIRVRPLRVLCSAASALLLAALASAAQSAEVTVLDPTPGATVLRVQLTDYEARAVRIGGAAWMELSLPGEGYLDVVGAPLLPHVARSLEIPGDRDVIARVVTSRWHDVAGVDVAPARGPILRTQDPAQVPYVFGASYSQNAWYPSVVATVREPFVMRDVRGAVVEIHPLQYDPVTRVLRVYDELVVSVESAGVATVNVLDGSDPVERADREFARLFQRQFLNHTPTRAIQFVEAGDMLVIAPAAFAATLQPFVAWKNSLGIQTTLVDVATIGNNASAIKSYVQSVYAAGNLSYVLLVGDIAEVASGSYAGGLSDPFYSTLSPDSYPEILVGRFSATTVAQVQTQVQRSIEYEQMDHSLNAGGWNTRAMGIASDQGPGHYGEYDNQHMNLIRTDLLGYGMTLVDQVYDPTATKTQVKNGLENGRRFVDYCGHGSQTSWGTTGWSNADVAALANDNLLPLIHSVACVNGDFSGTCFAEAWLRSTRNGEPIGAAGAYMSSINQYWNEPMYAQDETIDLIVAEGYWGMGALWFAGSCRMMDLMGQSGVDMFMTWICFGDPSLRVFGDPGCPPAANYCTAGVTSGGCAATLSAAGTPSETLATPFVITANGVDGQRSGVFFYGLSGELSAIWEFGSTSFLCVKAPRQRTDVQDSGGSLDACDGALTLDWNAYLTAWPNALGAPFVAGDQVWVQGWFRDPPAVKHSSLSNGLRFTICP